MLLSGEWCSFIGKREREEGGRGERERERGREGERERDREWEFVIMTTAS